MALQNLATFSQFELHFLGEPKNSEGFRTHDLASSLNELVTVPDAGGVFHFFVTKHLHLFFKMKTPANFSCFVCFFSWLIKRKNMVRKKGCKSQAPKHET